MEVDEKLENVNHKTDVYNTNNFGFSSNKVTPVSVYNAKYERTRNWVINSKPSLLQSLLKNNNKSSNNQSYSNQSFLSSPLNTSQLSWPVDPQMCDNSVHVEPLEDLEGSSILSEFESYYTAKSDLSASNNQINIPESSGDDSSLTSILDLDNSDEVTNVEDRLMQEK